MNYTANQKISSPIRRTFAWLSIPAFPAREHQVRSSSAGSFCRPYSEGVTNGRAWPIIGKSWNQLPSQTRWSRLPRCRRVWNLFHAGRGKKLHHTATQGVIQPVVKSPLSADNPTSLFCAKIKTTRRSAYGFRNTQYFFFKICENSRKPSQTWLSHKNLIWTIYFWFELKAGPAHKPARVFQQSIDISR